ncbi:hypothetical protein WD174_004438 [Salmonella enterica]|nr:hypothetical protein [Salmonella enterica subsp. enterica serovar Napoli]
MEKFEFDMGTFVTDTEEQDFSLDPQTQTLNELATMRPLYPELAHWTRFAFFVAWGAYSQDIYAISWVGWMTGHRGQPALASF